MRLLDVDRELPSVSANGRYTPRSYAILSHTWGDEEISLQDLNEIDKARNKNGWQKVQSARAQAKKDGYRFIWIDTCCIDTTSSSELSEAINSMYKWYRDAAVCYAYLEDIVNLPQILDNNGQSHPTVVYRAHTAALRTCRWFSRGWTLQELIAPRRIKFYGRTWRNLGDLTQLARSISEITGIDPMMLVENEERLSELRRPRLDHFSIAQRLSWAANRQTRRVEDRAYSLLGLMDVNMDIRYGEGARAFIRLQEELIQRSTDQSILAWPSFSFQNDAVNRAIFAPSPDSFQDAGRIVALNSRSYHMSNQGLHLIVPCLRTSPGRLQLWLRCRLLDNPTKALMLNVNIDRDRHLTDIQESSLAAQEVARDPIICTISPSARLELVDVDYATIHAKPLSVIIVRNARLRYADLRPPRLFVWLKLPQPKGPYLSLARARPAQTNSESGLWILEPAPGRSTSNHSLTMDLSFERAHVATVRLTLRWSPRECWAHVGLVSEKAADIEGNLANADDRSNSSKGSISSISRSNSSNTGTDIISNGKSNDGSFRENDSALTAMVESGNLPSMVQLNTPLSMDLKVEHARTLHVNVEYLEANEEQIVQIKIGSSRSLDMRIRD